MSDLDKPIRSLSTLHPEFRGSCITLAQNLIRAYEAGLTKTRFEPFETIRLSDRQDYLFHKARSKARGWQSAHQFGLACDFAAMTDDGWSWSSIHDWTFLRLSAEKVGLTVPIKWDKGHVQSPRWPHVKATLSA